MAADPYRYFRIEGCELADQLAKGALDLEKDARSLDLVPRLLRLAHTLKGAARVVKQTEIADFAHSIEDALAEFRDGDERLPRQRIDTVLKLVDSITESLSRLAPAAEAERDTGARAPLEEPFRTVRAEISEMDALLDGMAEAHVRLASMRGSMASLERVRHLAELLDEQLGSGRSGRPGGEGVSAKQRSLAEELRRLVVSVERGIARGVDHVDRELRQLRDTAERLRLLPAVAVFNAVERTARDAAQALGRRVTFVGKGGDVRLDAHVLGAVQGALIQVVRNAVAHGIEPEAERVAAGKPAEGCVSLDVIRRGDWVAFVCRDDGRGVDLEAVRRAARRKGVPPGETERSDSEALLRRLLEGGITTSRDVTEVSGRGIGLDVVRETANRLGGEVVVRTEAGRGTTLELVVPVSLASLDAVVVEAGGQTVAIPLDAVRGTLRVSDAEVARTSGGDTICFDGEPIPFVPLAIALRDGRGGVAAPRSGSAVVVASGGQMAGFAVTRLVGTLNVIQRPLPSLTPVDPVVAGASLDRDGKPQLVLAPEALVLAARRAHALPAVAAPSCDPILVVDDSLTTRMLEESILESAGYQVALAVSGEEALEKARQQRYRLILVDVEMPGMDGFSFIEQLRADPTLRDVPTILVTSRSSPVDRQRGEAVGADAYVTKGDFDQNQLLAHIRRLTERA
jgi:two-component system chemotaxis sensor kinase CheA